MAKPVGKSGAQTATRLEPKHYALIVIIALCLAWMGYSFFTGNRDSGPPVIADTPGNRAVMDLNSKLLTAGLMDVNAELVSESPLRLRITGAVKHSGELDELRAKIQEYRPENDYDFEVVVLD